MTDRTRDLPRNTPPPWAGTRETPRTGSDDEFGQKGARNQRKRSNRTIGECDEIRDHTAQQDKQNTSTNQPSKDPPLKGLIVKITNPLLAHRSSSSARFWSWILHVKAGGDRPFRTSARESSQALGFVSRGIQGTIRAGTSIRSNLPEQSKAAGGGVRPRGTYGDRGNLVAGGERIRGRRSSRRAAHVEDAVAGERE